MRKKINYFKTYEIQDLKDINEKTKNQNKNKKEFKLKYANGKNKNKKNDVQNLSTKLIDMGLKDKRIAIMGKNSYFWAVSYLAVAIVGIVVPIDKEASNENVKEFLNVSDAKAIIADDKYLNAIFGFKSELRNEISLIDIQNTSKYMNLSDLI